MITNAMDYNPARQADKAAEIPAREEYNQIPPEELCTWIVKTVWVAKRIETALDRGIVFEHIRTPADAETIVGDAWLRLQAKLDRDDARRAGTLDDGHQPRPLRSLIYQSVVESASSIYRAERRHASGLVRAFDEDGNPIEAISSARVAAVAIPGPEPLALAVDAIRAACVDKTDLALVELRRCGYTTTEAAAAVGISQPAASKRLRNIRERYNAI